ncbi:hypothetical protein [Virgibacillus sp. DJP39]|uniref:hypothetical protein n=1 Tax=Virgibacillus sp. DJP39 TaxID=3409790 RepID=UPI003BB4A57F
MIEKSSVIRIECPVCGHRLMDKGREAYGTVQAKCGKCRRVWTVDLGLDEFNLVSGKAIPRREGAGE